MLPLILFILGLETKLAWFNKLRSYGYNWKKMGDIYGVSITTVLRWVIA